MDALTQKRLILRLERIKDQIDRIEQALNTAPISPEVLSQAISAQYALESVGNEIIRLRLRRCIEYIGTRKRLERNVNLMLAILDRYAR